MTLTKGAAASSTNIERAIPRGDFMGGRKSSERRVQGGDVGYLFDMEKERYRRFMLALIFE